MGLGGHEGKCVASLVPDVRCAAPSSGSRLFCDGDFRALCFSQFPVRADQPCSAMGQHCVDLPTGGARCE